MISATSNQTSTSTSTQIDQHFERIFSVIEPAPLTDAAKISLTESDARSTPKHIEHLSNLVFYQAFIGLGRINDLDAIDIDDAHNEIKSYLSYLKQHVSPQITDSPDGLELVEKTFQEQQLEQTLRVGGLAGAKFPKEAHPGRYSMLRLNTGYFVHLTARIHPVDLPIIEQKFDLNLKPFAVDLKDGRPPKTVFGTGGQGSFGLGVLTTSRGSQEMAKAIGLKRMTRHHSAIRELSNAIHLKSPYLPEFYGFTEAKKGDKIKKYYLAYQLITGGDGALAASKLAALQHSDPSHHEKALIDIAEGYAIALQSLHEQGYYHSDVKPENFLHCKTGRIYITDLGLAHAQKTTYYGGTSLYLPPETKTSHYHADKHDSYSLGMTYLSLLFGGSHHLNGEFSLTSSVQADGLEHSFRLDPLQQTPKRFAGLVETQNLEVNNFIDLLIKLLDADPRSRPSVQEVCSIFETLDLQSASHELSQPDSMQAQVSSCTLPDHEELDSLL